jgi:hypothetical protein
MPPDDRFCGKCGKALGNDTAEADVQPPAASKDPRDSKYYPLAYRRLSRRRFDGYVLTDLVRKGVDPDEARAIVDAATSELASGQDTGRTREPDRTASTSATRPRCPRCGNHNVRGRFCDQCNKPLLHYGVGRAFEILLWIGVALEALYTLIAIFTLAEPNGPVRFMGSGVTLWLTILIARAYADLRSWVWYVLMVTRPLEIGLTFVLAGVLGEELGGAGLLIVFIALPWSIFQLLVMAYLWRNRSGFGVGPIT